MRYVAFVTARAGSAPDQPLQGRSCRARSASNQTGRDVHESSLRFGEHAPINRRRVLKPEEIRKLTAYLKRVFQNPTIDVKARPRKEDSAEVYVGEEFIGLIYKDEEEGDYNFQMAILDIDLN
jgi:hypothetical protein